MFIHKYNIKLIIRICVNFTLFYFFVKFINKKTAESFNDSTVFYNLLFRQFY